MMRWFSAFMYFALFTLFLFQWRRPASAKLIRHLLSFRTTRIAVLIIWWWLGLHFLISPK
jgi:hypothetical protein